MNNNAVVFLPHSFKDTYRVDTNVYNGDNRFGKYKNEILKFKPDIILIQLLSVSASHLAY